MRITITWKKTKTDLAGFSINLITGHLEEPMPNPIDEMTEEQKEYEAMKLVNMLDKLSRAVRCPERCQRLPPAPELLHLLCSCRSERVAAHVAIGARLQPHSAPHPPPTSALPADRSSALEGRPFLPTATAMIQLPVSSHAVTVTVTSSWLVSPPQFPLFQCAFCTAARDASL
ncbi:hypothetical protein J1605_020327 [Eschrichtius robustus]|uniref:Synembryn n=1 Tax=Eschrichtius robustus TaxID=9764 RepID=A0AB34HKS6_ESCRO|nr:hypothetical protein J1605_020327 [Eschrichtius robustus]